jgi:hypothetical protein
MLAFSLLGFIAFIRQYWCSANGLSTSDKANEQIRKWLAQKNCGFRRTRTARVRTETHLDRFLELARCRSGGGPIRENGRLLHRAVEESADRGEY